MIDHRLFIASYWRRRHEPHVRRCIRQAIRMLKAVRDNGHHKVWAHKPVTRP